MLRLTVFSLFVAIPQPVRACSCATMPSSCDGGWNSGETIFLGKVVGMDKMPGQESAFLSSYAAHFITEESFRGASIAGSENVVYTGAGGGDCGYPFVPGTRYLVYASRSTSDGRLHASICSETKPAVMAGGVLRELRAARDRTRPDDVFGTIGTAPRGARFEDLMDSQPLAGVPVRATGSNGISFSTKTDDRGVYAFSSLPPGAYGIELDLPPGFARAAPVAAEASAGRAACRVDSFASPDGRIEGTVVDSTGKALAGFVTIQPADPLEAAAAQRGGGLPGYDTGPDGKFSLPHLRPGRYRLVFHPRTGRVVNFRATFYWPSSPDDAIELAIGQHIDALQFMAPLEQWR
jgi:hypothetical protein